MMIPDYLWSSIGLAATVVIEGAYVPQLARLIRLKEANAITPFFPALSVIGRLLAIGYMWHRGENIFAFGICFGVFLRGAFLAQVLYYKWRAWWAQRLEESAVQI